jgi:hypothetical protein
MVFVMKALWRSNLVSSSDPDTVAEELMCQPADCTLDCYFQECESCKENQIVFMLDEFNGCEDVHYDLWEWKTDAVGGKNVRRLVKENKVCKMYELVQLAIEMLPEYTYYTGNDKVQKRAVRKLREKLQPDEALLHIDFLENYNCKYASEVQGVHFGGSRQQITLHTCMLYVGQGRKEAICTISESLQHNPVGIFVFLRPILEELAPDIQHLHFLSDSPVTQYRNRFMFYLMSQKIPSLFPDLISLSWHYSECGHGKGAADGIGGTLKRTCDRYVSFDKDVGNFAQFSATITKYV